MYLNKSKGGSCLLDVGHSVALLFSQPSSSKFLPASLSETLQNQIKHHLKTTDTEYSPRRSWAQNKKQHWLNPKAFPKRKYLRFRLVFLSPIPNCSHATIPNSEMEMLIWSLSFPCHPSWPRLSKFKTMFLQFWCWFWGSLIAVLLFGAFLVGHSERNEP